MNANQNPTHKKKLGTNKGYRYVKNSFGPYSYSITSKIPSDNFTILLNSHLGALPP
jgi:hypothetical protein